MNLLYNCLGRPSNHPASLIGNILLFVGEREVSCCCFADFIFQTSFKFTKILVKRRVPIFPASRHAYFHSSLIIFSTIVMDLLQLINLHWHIFLFLESLVYILVHFWFGNKWKVECVQNYTTQNILSTLKSSMFFLVFFPLNTFLSIIIASFFPAYLRISYSGNQRTSILCRWISFIWWCSFKGSALVNYIWQNCTIKCI